MGRSRARDDRCEQARSAAPLPRCPSLPETPQGAPAAPAHPRRDPAPLDQLGQSRIHAGGRFASHEREFDAAVRHVANDTGLTQRQVIVDYWIVRILYGLHLCLPVDGAVGKSQRRPRDRSAGSPGVGRWAFSGGNSLSMAWGITRRFSDDIDATLLTASRNHGSSNRGGRACRTVAEWAASDPAVSCGTTVGSRIRATMLTVAAAGAEVKLETTVLHPPGELAAVCEANSLLARRGDPEWVRRFPELGGFELPCVRPWWTAVNKLDALHRRAARGDLDGLRSRGRDLYDLWSIAARPAHAAQTRGHAPRMWRAASSAVRAPTPRPRHGYGTSPAFAEGTLAYEALRDGYHQAIDTTVWGNKPRFETAVKAARSLDTADRSDHI